MMDVCVWERFNSFKSYCLYFRVSGICSSSFNTIHLFTWYILFKNENLVKYRLVFLIFWGSKGPICLNGCLSLSPLDGDWFLLFFFFFSTAWVHFTSPQSLKTRNYTCLPLVCLFQEAISRTVSTTRMRSNTI